MENWSSADFYCILWKCPSAMCDSSLFFCCCLIRWTIKESGCTGEVCALSCFCRDAPRWQHIYCFPLSDPVLYLPIPHTAQPCKFSLSSLAEPAGAGLLEQCWLWRFLEEWQSMSACRSAVHEPLSHSSEVLRNQAASWKWPEFWEEDFFSLLCVNETHPGTLAQRYHRKSMCRMSGGFIWVARVCVLCASHRMFITSFSALCRARVMEQIRLDSPHAR